MALIQPQRPPLQRFAPSEPRVSLESHLSSQPRQSIAPPPDAPLAPLAPLPLTPPTESAPHSPRLSVDDANFAVPPPGYVEPPSYFSALGIAPGSTRPARYACVAISGTDRLRLVGFPNEDIAAIIDVVDALVVAKWDVQARTSPRQRVFEWKLKGRPWGGDGWNDGISPVRLLAGVFGGLSSTGYHVTSAGDVSCGRDTVFVKQGPKVHRTVFALTFRRPNTIVLIDAPPIVQNLFISTLSSWGGGAVGMENGNGHLKVHLAGQLFPGQTELEGFAVRELLCTILAVFDELGYDQIASLDIVQQGWSLGSAQSGQLDSWYFANRTSPTSSIASPSPMSTPSSPSPVSTPSVRSL